MFRTLVTALILSLCAAAPAMAQPSSIVLNANPVPIVDATINGRPVRLEVDLRLSDNLILNPAAAERLGVRRVPFMAIRVIVEGGGSLSGRIARPRLVFAGNRDAHALTGIFNVPVTDRADGVIGPGVLPYDQITVELGPVSGTTRDIVIAARDADHWTSSLALAGADLRLSFDVGHAPTVFNRVAATLLDNTGHIHADGELRQQPVILGLTSMMQPVRTELTAHGLALGPTYARTSAPLLGAADEDTIIVEGRDDDAPQPGLALGREALSRCASITMNRAAKTLTLRCGA